MPAMECERLADLAESIIQGVPGVSVGLSPQNRVPMLNPRDLLPPGPPSLDRLERVGVESSARRERALVRTDDVLVTARGTHLRSAVVPRETGGAIASGNLLVVRLRDKLLPEVLVAYLETESAKGQLLANVTRSTVGAFLITAKALGNLNVVVPPMPVQVQLANFVRAARESVLATERALELRKELVWGVVQRVFDRGDLSIDSGCFR